MLVEMSKREDAFTSHFALKSIEMPARYKQEQSIHKKRQQQQQKNPLMTS